MRGMRLAAVVATATAALVALPAMAQAAAITQPFHADSGDDCRYGVTDGTLTWRTGTGTSPLPFVAVDVRGTLTDRPTPNDPSVCRDDGYFSVASFVAYAGITEIDRNSVRADNGVVTFGFTLGINSVIRQIDRVVIQVCRHPLVTLPPSYCGKPAEYRAPPIA